MFLHHDAFSVEVDQQPMGLQMAFVLTEESENYSQKSVVLVVRTFFREVFQQFELLGAIVPFKLNVTDTRKVNLTKGSFEGSVGGIQLIYPFERRLGRRVRSLGSVSLGINDVGLSGDVVIGLRK